LVTGDLCRGDDVCGDASLANCGRRRLQGGDDDGGGTAVYRVLAPAPPDALAATPTLRPTLRLTAPPTKLPTRGDDDARPDPPRPAAPTPSPSLRGTVAPILGRPRERQKRAKSVGAKSVGAKGERGAARERDLLARPGGHL